MIDDDYRVQVGHYVKRLIKTRSIVDVDLYSCPRSYLLLQAIVVHHKSRNVAHNFPQSFIRPLGVMIPLENLQILILSRETIV